MALDCSSRTSMTATKRSPRKSWPRRQPMTQTRTARLKSKTFSRNGKGKSKGVKAFKQRDLVARAFAGDNVVQV